MSIVPSPGQMGPGAGTISSALMRHPSLFKGLGMGPALGGLGAVVYLADLRRARAEGFGDDVQAFRFAQADKAWAQIAIPFSILAMSVHNEQTKLDLPSSGGGGPGGLPNLHRPPPSIEETGEILSNPPMAGGKTGSPRRSTSKKADKRTKCPPGHYWHKGKKKCVRIPEKGWRRASLRYD